MFSTRGNCIKPRKTMLILIPSILIFLLSICNQVSSTHIKGTFETQEYFKFLMKFGFQKTDRHRQRDSFGYIFGNVTSKKNFSSPITLAVLDRAHFLEYYGNRTILNKDLACSLMFGTLNQTSYDPLCNQDGKDYLRRVPCPSGRLCIDEDLPWNVIKGHQFTYVIKDLSRPRFWYVSMVACFRNTTTCKWQHYQRHDQLEYDIWLVNGNPNSSGLNALTYQFSYDRQNTVELYLLFFVCYVILVPFQLYAARMQSHPVTRLFTASLLLEFLAICLILIHVLKFALDGVGYEQLEVAGDIFDILSRVRILDQISFFFVSYKVASKESSSHLSRILKFLSLFMKNRCKI